MTAPPQQLLQLARRASTIGITSLTGWTSYKANTDPLHIFWDLDHTILCSVTPLPSDHTANDEKHNDTNGGGEESSLIKPPTIHHFDQIDDDFPYTPLTVANTRTYFRPGAKVALWLCSKLGICHVYTAAQESYTMNILQELDPNKEVFRGVVLHRTGYPRIVRDGKDLTVVMGGGASNDDDNGGSNTDKKESNDIRLKRAILFDDKVSNFKPQKYENGVSVLPFSEERLNKCLSSTNKNSSSSSSSSNENYHCVMDNWTAYLQEVKEMARLVGISVWGTVHLSGDVRKVVDWVRKLNEDDNEV